MARDSLWTGCHVETIDCLGGPVWAEFFCCCAIARDRSTGRSPAGWRDGGASRIFGAEFPRHFAIPAALGGRILEVATGADLAARILAAAACSGPVGVEDQFPGTSLLGADSQ